MASTPSVGGSPVNFVDASGAQFSIPLSSITFPFAPGAPDPSSWPGWQGAAQPDQTAITGWIAYLAGQGLLAAGKVSLPPPAFSIAAANAGSEGNDITVNFGAVTPDVANPAATTVAVTVATTQVYADLTVAGIGDVLGTVAGGGTQPGLAYVGTALTTLPTAKAATAFGAPPEFDVPGSGTGVLLPTTGGADASLIKAAISAVDATAETFTLTLSWTKTATVALSDIGATFAYLITVTPPPGGFVYAPAAGSSVTLLGGTDPAASAPTVAKATVVSG